MPSDTIYGLSCAALDASAVQRIYELKGRSYHKPLIVLLADSAQGAQLSLDAKALAPAAKFWPAPLTLIAPARPRTPEYLHRGSPGLAVRVPADDQLRELLRAAGPLVSTSANPESQPPATSVAEAQKYFGGKLDFYIDAGRLPGRPSTIVNIQNGKLKVIRRGAFKVPQA